MFSAIGGSVFLAGFALQAALTGVLHVPPVVSYLVQAVVSVQASFLLNRWLTWRDRDTAFWPACVRFNAQKVVTVSLNLALYAGLLHLGMNYLVANVALTAVFTVVNFVAGDRFVFTPGRTSAGFVEERFPVPAAPPVRALARGRPVPGVSVVIPCRDNEATIGAAVESLLDQDYPGLREIVLIGSPDDRTWAGLAGITDPRLVVRELETPPGVRDANFKRDAGIKMSTSDLVALVDSDIVLPPEWMSQAVAELADGGAACVAGGMVSIHDSFWGRFTDSTVIGAKTPRVTQSYTVTSEDFGVRGRKPPVTANVLFTRELYDRCPIDPWWSHGSYEDYEWFWRVVEAGYEVQVSRDLFGWHHHRRGMAALAREYRRSSRGCAYFIRAHPDSPFAQRRLRQAIVLPVTGAVGLAAAASAVADGYSKVLAGLVAAAMLVVAGQHIARTRRLEASVYPAVGLVLGVVFTTGLITHLIRSAGAMRQAAPATARGPAASPTSSTPRARYAGPRLPQPPQDSPPPRRPWWRHPLTVVLAVQAGLSLTLVWSNTAFTDEADYLWLGHLVIANWLHGASWPSAYGQHALSGSPIIYPPIGALADSVGGLAGARILSLVFMLGATILLYHTTSHLLGRRAALFSSILWALSEPVIRLAFATHDPLSVLFTALSAWLIVQAGLRWRHGELVAAAAAALALANATAYTGIIIDPVVIGFAFLVWSLRLGTRQAAYSAGWLTAALALFTSIVLTFSKSWLGLTSTLLGHNPGSHQGIILILNDIWKYSGLIVVLAAIGAITAVNTEKWQRAMLLVFLGCAAFIVPISQFSDPGAWSHLAYGIWFAVIVAGYGVSEMVRWLPQFRKSLALLTLALVLAYPTIVSWQSASARYTGWPNAQSFVSAFRPVVAHSSGLIFASGLEHVAQYYSPQGHDWRRWLSDGLTLNPTATKKNSLGTYYKKTLASGKYGLIALFYSAPVSTVAVLGTPVSRQISHIYQKLTGLAGVSPRTRGLRALTLALEDSSQYHLVTVGAYDNAHNQATYVIWQKVGGK